MPFQPYHTGLQKQVEFKPLKEGVVTIYNCGPTVYSTPHIGNFRSFLFADLLRRFLEWRGYAVRQIMNITDVGHLTQDDMADAEGEDKLQAKARELGWDAFKVARYFEDEFHRDRQKLGCRDPESFPRATEHIPDMLAMIQNLLEGEFAYFAGENNDVYFRIERFPEYGKLSHKDLDELVSGARVDVNSDKKHPGDFALWKTDPGHLMQWDPHADSLWADFPGKRPNLDARFKPGFPGWHIECSAMSMRYLGETLDIHTGGEDNIFPHHECEIAQSTCATGKTFARYWMHARHLLVDNKKMSKREGTLYTLEDIEKKGYSAIELRYLLMSNHYRQPMNFTMDGLEAARASIARMQTCRDTMKERAGLPNGDAAKAQQVEEACGALKERFRAALDDDLNMPNALAAVFEFVSTVNSLAPAGNEALVALSALESVNEVLGVMSRDAKSHLLTREAIASAIATLPEHFVVGDLLGMSSFDAAQVTTLIAARQKAKSGKDFATADAIRDALKAKKVQLEDTPEGVRFKLPT